MKTAKQGFEEVFAALAEQGWRVEQTAPRSYKCAPPDRSRPVVFLNNGDDGRNFDNMVANLRRSGFQWPPPLSVAVRRPLALVEAAKPDEAWNRLKDARALFELAADEVDACEQAYKVAQARWETACVERDKAAAALRKEKETFDKLFSGER